MNPPKFVLCAGLHRSASTWLYNATLMLLRSRTKATGIYSETIPFDLAARLQDETSLVIKCHKPDPNLIALSRLAGAPVILSVRDPRDCLVSLETRFRMARAAAIEELNASASALLQLTGYPRKLMVKYESSDYSRKTLESLAALLDIPVTSELVSRIADELSLERMRDKIAGWESSGLLDPARPTEIWTEESHWHANHCGDGSIGKYVECLSARDAAIVSDRLKPFFDEFGYEPSARPALESGDSINFNGEHLIYSPEGFSPPEHWGGAWTEQTSARIMLPLAKGARRLQLEISLVRGPCFDVGQEESTAQLFINGRKVARLFDKPDLPGELVFLCDRGISSDCVSVEFRFENLVSPKTLGINADERLIGVGVRSLRVMYQ